MAGSKKYMVYTADSGSQYTVSIDESNGELAGFDDVTIAMEIAGTVPPPLPKNIKMRYATLEESATGSSRKIAVGKPTAPIWIGNVFTLLLPLFGGSLAGQAVAWGVRLLVEEVANRQLGNSRDTGFLDDDNT